MAPNTISYEFPDPADMSSYEDDSVYSSGSEEEDEPADWTPNTCAYEVQEYGDDATMFVADKPMIVHVPNPVNFVDPDYWNMVQYRDHMEYLQTQADLESKRVEHTKLLAWRRNIRRGLPTESRLGKAKRILREQQETEQAAVMKANAKLAPKYGSSRKKGGGRKGRRGVVVVDAAVVKQRRAERRKVAKAAQVLRACPVAVATPVTIVAAPVFIAPPELSDDPEEAAEQAAEQLAIEDAERAEIVTACSTAKPWTPIQVVQVESAPKQESWTVVDRRRKPAGFVESTATRGRRSKQLKLDLTPPPRPERKTYSHSVDAVPAGWVFTHPCMDLRSHINATTPLCKHFQFGTCNFGTACKFKHNYGPCKFGSACRRRGTCKRAHPPAPAPKPAPPAPAPKPAPPAPEVEYSCELLESGGFTLHLGSAGPPLPPPPLKFPDFTLVGLTRQEIKEGPPRRATSAAPRPTQPTRTCLFWKQGKVCKHGANCRFAHFDIAPKTCKFWSAGMHCKHGAKCRFSHG